MNIKETLKKNKALKLFVKKIKVNIEYIKDAKHLNKYLAENEETKEQIEYKMLLLVHSIEKGMCYPNPRPFGYVKIQELISLLLKYEDSNYNLNSNSYNMSISIISNWLEYYCLNNWDNHDEYKQIYKLYYNHYNRFHNKLQTGYKEFNVKIDDVSSRSTYEDVITTRFSARDFSGKAISFEDLNRAIDLAKRTPSACNRQMVKAHFIDNPSKKDYLSKLLHGTGGLNLKTVKYFVITFDSSALDFYGERNQGYLNAGLFAMNLVNSLHSIGIGTCFLQFANTSTEEKLLKEKLDIPLSERIAVCIGCGYYVEGNRIPVSCRKNNEEILTIH